MACLKLDDLEMALTEETILLEIKLATMLYYFKVCRYEYQVYILIPYPFRDDVLTITKMCN